MNDTDKPASIVMGAGLGHNADTVKKEFVTHGS